MSKREGSEGILARIIWVDTGKLSYVFPPSYRNVAGAGGIHGRQSSVCADAISLHAAPFLPSVSLSLDKMFLNKRI
jgi:hypothetical protein